VLAIAGMPSGYDIAIEIFYMRLHSDKDRKVELAPEFVATGRQLIQQFTFTSRNDRDDYEMAEITKSCLHGEKGASVTTDFCRRLKRAIENCETNAFYHDDLLVDLFSAQPIAALEGLCGGDQKELELGIRILRDVGRRKPPLAVIPDGDLLGWCDQDPQSRYPALAQVITISERMGEHELPRWTRIAMRFLEKAPDPSAILRRFTARFMPEGVWRGSLATILESNGSLLDQLEEYPTLSAVVAQQKVDLRLRIDEERRRETAWGRQENERFE